LKARRKSAEESVSGTGSHESGVECEEKTSGRICVEQPATDLVLNARGKPVLR
jgi:hypothetical protein